MELKQFALWFLGWFLLGLEQGGELLFGESRDSKSARFIQFAAGFLAEYDVVGAFADGTGDGAAADANFFGGLVAGQGRQGAG